MSLFDIAGDILGAVSAGNNAANSSKAYQQAGAAISAGLASGVNTLNAGRDAALAYLNPAQSLGVSAGQALGNAYGLYGAAPAGSQAGLTRADPYNIGAPTAPGQATFNAPAFSFDPSQVNPDSDPGLAYARSQALGGIQQGAFAAGKGLSGAATVALATKAGDIANQGFNAAYARDLSLETQRYQQDYGAASDAYNRDTTFNNTNYAQNYGAATDAYARQNAQFQNYLSGVTGLNTAGNTAASQAANVQTGVSTTGANLQANAAGSIANAITGKAIAQNAANTQQTSYLQNGINSFGNDTSSVLKYLGLGG